MQTTQGATGAFTWAQVDAASLSVTFALRPVLEINAGTGTYTLTGTAATLLVTRIINAAPGTYTLTGIAATLVKGLSMNAAPGAYTLTGTDATLLAGRVMNAEPGTYTLTGVDATLTYAAGPPPPSAEDTPGLSTTWRDRPKPIQREKANVRAELNRASFRHWNSQVMRHDNRKWVDWRKR